MYICDLGPVIKVIVLYLRYLLNGQMEFLQIHIDISQRQAIADRLWWFWSHLHGRGCSKQGLPWILSRELKMLHLKFGIQGFHNTIMTLIFIYKATYITWLPFVFFFSQHLLCLLGDVTCCVIFKMKFWLLLHSSRSKNSNEIKMRRMIYFPNDNIFFDSVLIIH